MTGVEVLELQMAENDANASTVKGYLKQLLNELWSEGSSFSGKRPFGNSGWEFDLYACLITNKAIKGKVDEYGCVEDITDNEIKKANKLIAAAIEAL